MRTTIIELSLEKISQFIDGVIRGRDPDLADHLQRLEGSALRFAHYLGFSSEDAQMLAIGASMHDVGKLGIDEQILHKPASLTPTEFSVIKQHPVIGHEMIAPLELDQRIVDSVLHHHENFDGSGYPHGLSGQSIPLFARAVRIWDSYDALTMNRHYHRGESKDHALAILQRDHVYYDPELLKPFIAMMRA